jgi:hypothetical protein
VHWHSSETSFLFVNVNALPTMARTAMPRVSDHESQGGFLLALP